MPTTSNFGWTTPADTDLVKDGALAIRTLGNGIDTSMAELKGGTTGQILSKTSNTDMDFTWINNDQGDITAVNVSSPITGGGTSGAVTVGIQDGTTAQKGAVQLENSTSSNSTTTAAVPASVKSAYDLANAAIPKSIIDAAGDLIYGTANDTVARLGIGTAGQILKVNSGGTAPEWGAASAGKILQVITTAKTDTFTTTSTSLVDVTGLSVTITPTLSTSTILVLCSVQYSISHVDGQQYLQLLRGSTSIAQGDSAGSRTRTTAQGAPVQVYALNNYALTFIDNPATTSATTYKIQTRVTASTGYINRTVTDLDNSVYPRGISTITVMEIGA